jgi:hypothetical protein
MINLEEERDPEPPPEVTINRAVIGESKSYFLLLKFIYINLFVNHFFTFAYIILIFLDINVNPDKIKYSFPHPVVKY